MWTWCVVDNSRQCDLYDWDLHSYGIVWTRHVTHWSRCTLQHVVMFDGSAIWMIVFCDLDDGHIWTIEIWTWTDWSRHMIDGFYKMCTVVSCEAWINESMKNWIIEWMNYRIYILPRKPEGEAHGCMLRRMLISPTHGAKPGNDLDDEGHYSISSEVRTWYVIVKYTYIYIYI